MNLTKAVISVLDSFEKAQLENYRSDPRFGILHLQITDDKIINRFKELNVIAYAEPICVNNDLHMAEERVGKERLKTSYNYRAFIDKGIPLCISSDCPVDSLNPMDSIYVAVIKEIVVEITIMDGKIVYKR